MRRHHRAAPSPRPARPPSPRQAGLPSPRPARLPLAAWGVALALTACGGGGGSSTPPAPPPPSAVTLSGTAAAGLPLTGTVTVKDAAGASKTVAIGANGSYSVDVTGMTAPLLLRAEGQAGATRYVIHSASVTADASGTVNITPLTDLVVANAAGQVADAYFASGAFAGLSAADLEAESAALKAKLLPVLSALGVDAALDLMRTPFTPLASALDHALEVIRVSVDVASHTATLTNLVNQITITDDLAVKAAADGGSTPLSGDGMAGVADDLTAIRKLFTDISALFATGLPAPGLLLPYLSPEFLNGDVGRDDFAEGIVQEPDMVGTSFTDITIESLSPAQAGALPLAAVHFIHRSPGGQGRSLNTGWLVQKGEDGKWRLHGDQAVLEVSAEVHQVMDSVGGCRASGFEVDISDNADANSASIHHVRVTGPGLPANGLEYRRPSAGGAWALVAAPGANRFWYPMTDSCGTKWGAAGVSDEAIAAIPDQARYTARAYSASGTELPLRAGGGSFPLLSPMRPMTLAELKLATFPQVTTSAAVAGYLGGEFTVSGSAVYGGNGVWMYLGLTDSQGQLASAEATVLPTPGGGFTHRFNLPVVAAASAREWRVGSTDAYWRTVMTIEER